VDTVPAQQIILFDPELLGDRDQRVATTDRVLRELGLFPAGLPGMV